MQSTKDAIQGLLEKEKKILQMGGDKAVANIFKIEGNISNLLDRRTSTSNVAIRIIGITGASVKPTTLHMIFKMRRSLLPFAAIIVPTSDKMIRIVNVVPK